MRIYNQKDEVLHSHISNVKSYLNSLGYEGERRKFLFNIGNKWEKICYEIAQHYYGKTIKHPILTNNKIPDLLPVAKDLTWENGKLKYAPLLIECKKSLYFTESDLSGKQDLFTNPTVKRYLPFCDKLEFWILDHSEYDDYESLENEKITYRFADDFLDSELPDKIKNRIKRLLSEVRKKYVSDEWKLQHEEDFVKIEELKELRPEEF